MRDAADDALQSYLDALLQPADSRPFAEPEPRLRRALPPVAPPRHAVAAAVVPVIPAATVSLAPAPATVLRSAAETTAVAPPVVVAAPDPVAVTPTAAPAVADALAPAQWLVNGRPAWAQEAFEALLFRVGGLNLAVPLVELGSVYPLPEEALTPIFGQADWFLGLLPLKGGNLRVIDSAKVVMPERYDTAMTAAYRYVVTLNGSDWGLAVDSISDAVRLDPEQVRWRGARSKRPWLAGTVVDQMCALLDVAQLTWTFQQADRRRGGRAPAR